METVALAQGHTAASYALLQHQKGGNEWSVNLRGQSC